VHALAEQLLKTIRKQESIRAGDRVAAAVSGGADSVALLGLLLEVQTELGIVLSLAHVNHKLRGEESDEDERFVAKVAGQHGLELHVCAAPLDSKQNPDQSLLRIAGTEAAARELRYKFFRQLTREGHVTKIATAHTLDDQAETVLLRIFRGTGIRGLAGIHPRMTFEEQGRPFGEVVRPLLGFRRAALREFLCERGQNWREDSSNWNIAFLRNRLRQRFMPIIRKEFGEAAIEHMGELAEIARAEEEHWRCGHPEIATAAGTANSSSHDDTSQAASLQVKPLLALPLATQRRLIRAWLEVSAPDFAISCRLIEQALDLAQGPIGKKMQLPNRQNLRREDLRRTQHELRLESEPARDGSEAIGYEYVLAVPGAVEIPDLGVRFEALLVDISTVAEHASGQLLDPARMPKEVVIRNWRAGDRFWPAHTAAPKKVKELLTDRHVTGTRRKLWPVAVAGGCDLIWMQGFAVPEELRPSSAARTAIWIREMAGLM
jgi:tRNA(Ile)-lysidine synthase